MQNKRSKTENNKTLKEYLLDDQVRFILRKVNQRHASIFSNLIPNDLTPVISLIPLGKVIIERSIPNASLVTEKTLSPLSEEEQVIFLSLLQKISSLA